MKIKAIFFDLDNTLYAYDDCNNYAKNIVFKYLSKKFQMSTIKIKGAFNKARQLTHQRLKHTAASHHRLLYFQTLLEIVTGKTEHAETLKIYQLYWTYYFKKMKLGNGWLKLLKKLKSKGIKILILTDLTAHIQFEKLKKLKIDRLIDFVVTSEEVGIEKPNSKIFSYALKKADCKASEVIMIGDDLNKDINGAQKAGLKTLHVNHMPNQQLFDKILTT